MFDLEGRGVPAVHPLAAAGADVRAKTNYFIWNAAHNQTGPRLKDKLEADEGAL